MWLVNLNYNFECDCLIELSDNKLSDNNLASELVGNRSAFKPFTIEEIVIFKIKSKKKNISVIDWATEVRQMYI